MPSTGVFLAIEALLLAGIIYKVPYTEIDYSTYIQQAESFLNGELHYPSIRGDSGPLVYPAGHLYFYAFVGQFKSLYFSQIVFAVLYLVNLFVVLQIYKKIFKHLDWKHFALILSKRIHSIYVLRLFNDPVAMLFYHIGVLLLLNRKCYKASIIYRYLKASFCN
jgi:alpha-1,3-mannosyltransferase